MDINSAAKFDAYPPRTVWIDGHEVPTYQTFWEEKTSLRSSINGLKAGMCLLSLVSVIILVVLLMK